MHRSNPGAGGGEQGCARRLLKGVDGSSLHSFHGSCPRRRACGNRVIATNTGNDSPEAHERIGPGSGALRLPAGAMMRRRAGVRRSANLREEKAHGSLGRRNPARSRRNGLPAGTKPRSRGERPRPALELNRTPAPAPREKRPGWIVRETAGGSSGRKRLGPAGRSNTAKGEPHERRRKAPPCRTGEGLWNRRRTPARPRSTRPRVAEHRQPNEKSGGA